MGRGTRIQYRIEGATTVPQVTFRTFSERSTDYNFLSEMLLLKIALGLMLMPQAVAFYGRIDNPSPVLGGVVPAKVVAGSPSQALTINGRNFLSSSSVELNGEKRPTTYVNANRLTIQLTAADVAAAGALTVVVVNPPPGGGSSNPGQLVVAPSVK